MCARACVHVHACVRACVLSRMYSGGACVNAYWNSIKYHIIHTDWAGALSVYYTFSRTVWSVLGEESIYVSKTSANILFVTLKQTTAHDLQHFENVGKITHGFLELTFSFVISFESRLRFLKASLFIRSWFCIVKLGSFYKQFSVRVWIKSAKWSFRAVYCHVSCKPVKPHSNTTTVKAMLATMFTHSLVQIYKWYKCLLGFL